MVAPQGLENLSATLKAQKEQGKIDKLREREINAKRGLKVAAGNHCAHLTILAGGIAPAIARARSIVKALRVYRGAIAAPMAIIEAFGESITPAGEYDAGPVSNFIPEHGECIVAVRAAQADYKTWCDDKRFSYRGPKSIKLREAITKAETALREWINRQFTSELLKAGLPENLTCKFGRSESREFSRARIAVRSWPARKWELAQAYVEALNVRRKAQAKCVDAGIMVQAKAIHADGRQTFAVLTPERLQANISQAKGTGVQIVILKSNIAAIPAGVVDFSAGESEPVSITEHLGYSNAKEAIAAGECPSESVPINSFENPETQLPKYMAGVTLAIVESENSDAVLSSIPTLLEFAKSKLPQAIADLVTEENQCESYRAQWRKEYPEPQPLSAPIDADAKRTPQHLAAMSPENVLGLQSGFNRFAFGFADVGEVHTFEGGGQIQFLGSFDRLWKANAVAISHGVKPRGYLAGKFERGWVVWKQVESDGGRLAA